MKIFNNVNTLVLFYTVHTVYFIATFGLGVYLLTDPIFTLFRENF